MGYLAQLPVLQETAASTLSKAPDFMKSLDYKKMAKFAVIAGASILAFKSLKLFIYGEAAAAAYQKAKELIR